MAETITNGAPPLAIIHP